MTERNGLAPYTFVVGKDTETTHVEYHGEELPGVVAAVVVVGDVGDIIDVARDERAYLLVKIRMPYVHIRRDEATLHGGEVEAVTGGEHPSSHLQRLREADEGNAAATWGTHVDSPGTPE